ncbi:MULTISPECIES: hypothetical protein [Prauserella salsuginis group]|uniref:Mce-associated membrane protein n=1 Tax=Prauserella salsuginis TaxID=387889 RepID=A0ABW6G5S7_9PSEU|nr:MULTISPECIES: hypothetical protein [Prauserella salsuginis group]MCR3719186.1 hypothetical protein [Prauserella flava]MCR3735801.1 hypothetical protein [Prauserella salsuginis]
MPTTSLPHRRWLVPVLVAVVALTVGGGLVAREVYQSPSRTSRPAAPATSAAPNSVEPADQPGPTRVQLTSDAAAHPDAKVVRGVLQNYFDAINRRDYDLWVTTVVAERAALQSEQEWRENYRSTQDGSIRVYRIEAAPDDGLTALLGFTSLQDAADAPDDLQSDCIRWRLAFPLTKAEGDWRIGTVPPGTVPEQSRC